MAKDLSPYGPRHATEPTHDDTYDVARELGIHPMHAYGYISAFRARYPVEVPHGRLRDATQVERLALWDGDPGQLAAAFECVGIVDRVDGQLVAHDHEHYAGAVLAAREAGRRRTRGWRDRQKGVQARDGDGVTVTSRDTSPSLLLTYSSDPDPDPDQIAHAVPPRGNTAQRLGYRGVGFMENPAEFPQTPEALVGKHGESLAKSFPMLDGRNSRPGLLDAVRAVWIHYVKARDAPGGGHAVALGRITTYLADIADRHRRSYEADGRPGNPRASPRKGKPVPLEPDEADP